MHNQPKLIGTSAAARILGVSEETVRKYDAQLKPLRTEDGRRMFRADAVERLAAERSRK